MKRKTLPIIFATGMVLGICAAACGAAGTVTNANDATDTSVIIESENTEKTAENISNTETVSTVNMSTDTTTIGAVTSVSELDLEGMFTERDIDTGYDESNSTIITLSDSSAEVTGEGVNADGTTITITSEGTYIFSGELKEGQIIVDVDDSEKVQIVLNGVTITNDDSACIYVKCADKVFVTLAQGTENSLSDSGSEYIQEDSETNVDGVIYSKDDITFNGSGSLTINASYANGIVGKDDVKFTGGTYNLSLIHI